MKQFQKLILISLFLFLSPISFASFQPLIGSEWSLAHPNELPFSECSIGNTPYYDIEKHRYEHECFVPSQNSYELNWLGVGFVGCASNQFVNAIYLNCFSNSTNLAYSIAVEPVFPIAVPSLSFSFVQGTFARIISSTLDGKTFGELIGNYHGFKVGIAVAGGAHYGRYKNAHQVSIRWGGYQVAFLDLTLGYSGFSLTSLKDWSKNLEDLKNPYVLTELPEEYYISRESSVYQNEITQAVLLRIGEGSRDIALSTSNGFVYESPLNRTTSMGGSVVWNNEDSVVIFNGDGSLVYHSVGKSVRLRNKNPGFQLDTLKNYRFVRDAKPNKKN